MIKLLNVCLGWTFGKYAEAPCLAQLLDSELMSQSKVLENEKILKKFLQALWTMQPSVEEFRSSELSHREFACETSHFRDSQNCFLRLGRGTLSPPGCSKGSESCFLG